MIFIASKSVASGMPIRCILYGNENWILLGDEDIPDRPEDLNYSEDDFVLYDEELVYERIPSIKGKLNHEQETRIYIDKESGHVNINPKHKNWGVNPDNFARATNQVNIEMSFLQFFKVHKRLSGEFILLSILFLLASIYISWIFLFYFARIAYYQTLTILSNRNLFLSGTLNAGIIIDLYPTKIAVLSDLSMGFGKYPIIRIINTTLPKSCCKIGARVATAGTYQNCHEEQSFWDFYKPMPLQWAVAKNELIEKKLNEIPIYDWIKLKRELKKLPLEITEGYYPIDKDTTSWKDIDTPKFVQFDEEESLELIDEYDEDELV